VIDIIAVAEKDGKPMIFSLHLAFASPRG